MKEATLKSAVIEALHAPPGFSRLRETRHCNQRQLASFQRWLDESGMALYFLTQLEQTGHISEVPEELVANLRKRRDSNRIRMQDMFAELVRVNNALLGSGTPYAVIKGFTLAPEFCPDISLRHQSDIDLLVSAPDVNRARDAIATCGYSVEEESTTGEIRMSGPLQHCPTKHDDIYAIQRHRRVELHTSIFEELQGVRINLPGDYLSSITQTRIEGEDIPVLNLADQFVLQCLHAFRHVLASWGRLCWLYEISYFLRRHNNDESLLSEISSKLVGEDLRAACGLVLLLTRTLFLSGLPPAMRQLSERANHRIHAWVDEFGCEWSLTGMQGSKKSLFIHREFVSDAREWSYWLRRRLFPFEQRPVLAGAQTQTLRAADQFRQACRYAERGMFHVWELAKYASDLVRWRRAVQQL